MRFSPISVTSEAELLLVLDGGPGPALVSVALQSVGVAEDEFALSFSSPAENRPDMGWVVPCTGVNQLSAGLYRLGRLAVMGETEQVLTLPNEPVLLELREPDQPLHDEATIRARHRHILERREQEFRAGFGRGDLNFRALVFVRDVLITRRMRLGRYEILPAGDLSQEAELLAVTRFLQENGIGELTIPSEQTGPPIRPVLVMHFPVVLGGSLEDARDQVVAEAERLVSLLALTRGASGDWFAVAVHDRRRLMTWLREEGYGGNLLGGFVSGEEPPWLRERLAGLRSDPRALLYTRLYREALGESDPEQRCARMWSILEQLARDRGIVGAPMTNWQGSPVLNRHGQQRTATEAEDFVGELLRQVLMPRQVGEDTFAAGLTRGSLSEQVPIWYRRRNCVVHGGECLCRDPQRTDLAGRSKQAACKAARDESGPGDRYLGTLVEVTKTVVTAEIP